MSLFVTLVEGVADLIGNVAQVGKFGYATNNQEETVSWARRGFKLDSQAFCLDALDHAKEEVKSSYRTYVERISSVLLVLALIWPWGLSIIQYSDCFVPRREGKDSHDLETEHPWLIHVWVFLAGCILVLPFWGILMLLHCKLKLDKWLETALASVKMKGNELVVMAGLAEPEPQGPSLGFSPRLTFGSRRRRAVSPTGVPKTTSAAVLEGNNSGLALVNLSLQYQEYLGEIWNGECRILVQASTSLLWLSVVAALLLVSVSFWMFLHDTGGLLGEPAAPFLVVVLTFGCAVPLVYIQRQHWKGEVKPEDYFLDE
mmetsp:Transcript_17366/g.40503  ORF Transcript_17366/g.40503 Transcript_17366/m.40503 type:complete len:315 (+) Transcript_17366:154-1098(+)